MAYGLQDVIIQKEMLLEGNQNPARKLLEKQKLEALLGLCETTACRRQVLLSYFKEEHSGGCQNCDTCLSPVATFNATESARQALSCVYRTGQQFGVSHLVDVLSGKDTDKVIRFDHHRLSVFGIGKTHGAHHWQSIFRQLISKGLLNIDMQRFGALRLSSSCAPVLKGQCEVFLRPISPRKKKLRKPAEKSAPLASISLNQTLFDALKQMRLDLAQKMQVPPYVIFHDRTLLEIAQKNPLSIEALKSIHGIGEHKLEKYGSTLLGVIGAQHASHHG
ncbi:MAG: ATP-dependent DNA helicase RecQ [bacterium ADurb.BinA186]|nr:MAG: ATP-dependent DNA helicase RecQ [bacterium ADurb.BinA186]